ncbi:hypothetical protein Cantr_06345 [Candida viswanathii]|uniref:Uncharacterized protein n=1 Tax=Candida viswanathii TaxID=5486 RepID=A0A367XXT1_9ASCO|nr:hypothetical protein Cantr_06345 [Candida viswanathii]
MIAKLMGVTYLKNKLHKSSSTTSANLQPTTAASFPHSKSTSSLALDTAATTIKRSKLVNPPAQKLKQKRRSNSHEVVNRSQVRRSNTVPSGIALKKLSSNRTPRSLTSLPNSPSFNHGLSLIEEFAPPSRSSSQGSNSSSTNNNYNLTSNNSGSNLMSLQNGYLMVDYTGKDDASSLYTGKSNNKLDDYYDSDYDNDNDDDNDSVTNLWVLPRNNNNFSIPRTHSTKKKNVRFI